MRSNVEQMVVCKYFSYLTNSVLVECGSLWIVGAFRKAFSGNVN